MSSSVVRLNPATLPNSSEIGYSQISIVKPGRMAYISGQVAWRADGGPVPSRLKDQMKLVSDNARSALDALGARSEDIVIARIYLVDLTPERLEELMPAFLGTFEGSQPCVTGVGVEALASPELQVEMELVVRMPD